MKRVDSMSSVNPKSKRHIKAPQKIIPTPLGPTSGLAIQPKRMPLALRISLLVSFVITLCLCPEIVGQMLLIGYAVLAIVKRFSAAQTFILAMLFLLLSPVMVWVSGSEENGAVLAGYSFVFLGVGLLQLIAKYRRLVASGSETGR